MLSDTSESTSDNWSEIASNKLTSNISAYSFAVFISSKRSVSFEAKMPISTVIKLIK